MHALAGVNDDAALLKVAHRDHCVCRLDQEVVTG